VAMVEGLAAAVPRDSSPLVDPCSSRLKPSTDLDLEVSSPLGSCRLRLRLSGSLLGLATSRSNKLTAFSYIYYSIHYIHDPLHLT